MQLCKRWEEEGEDIENDGDYWEFQNLEKLDNKNLHMILFKNLICFSYKYKGKTYITFFPTIKRSRTLRFKGKM